MLKTTSEQSGGRLLTYILNIMKFEKKSPPLGDKFQNYVKQILEQGGERLNVFFRREAG